MQFSLNWSAEAWARVAQAASAFKHKIQVFDLRDFLSLIAATISATFILSFLIFSTYYIFDRDPLVLMIAVTVLSILSSFSIFLHFRIDLQSERSQLGDLIKIKDKLEQSSLELARIYPALARFQEEVSLSNDPARETLMASTRFSSSLVRVFAVGVGIVAIGLVAVLIGMATGKLEAQFAGSTLLAIGCVLSTLAVIRGENLDQQSL